MTRSLFFFTCLVAMIATLTAVVIRLELASPGVSVLFQDQTGGPDGARFGTVAMTHALTSYLAVMLLGTTMIAAAREKGARVAGLLMWIGVIFCLATGLMLIAAELPLHWFVDDLPNKAETATGWTIYPPLVGSDQQTVLSLLTLVLTPDMTFFDPTLSGFPDLSRYLALPAASLLYIGAFTQMSCERGMGWLGVVGTIVVAGVAVLSVPLLLQSPATFALSGWLVPSFLLLACGSIRVLDDGPAWTLVLSIGMFAAVMAEIALLVHPATLNADGTMADVMGLYVLPFGLVWFALPALMLFRDGTRLDDARLWAVTGAITFGLILWIAPLVFAGHQGQPFRYVDYPDAFARANLAGTIGVVIFTALMLSSIVYLRRNRA